ncbi:hypothetical protein PybrP1_003022 [[Pythium] brassicae (nom. inval.)]|nr:hypothetical protein PybrP1_003022 [[Pythium] brassicae (nom. inval.)]
MLHCGCELLDVEGQERQVPRAARLPGEKPMTDPSCATWHPTLRPGLRGAVQGLAGAVQQMDPQRACAHRVSASRPVWRDQRRRARSLVDAP